VTAETLYEAVAHTPRHVAGIVKECGVRAGRAEILKLFSGRNGLGLRAAGF
jgi:hypothetical protein